MNGIYLIQFIRVKLFSNNLTTWKKFRVGGYTDNRLLKKSSKHYESTGQLQPGEYGHDDTGMYKILSLNICKRRFTDFAKRYDTVPEIFQKAVNTENNGPVTLKYLLCSALVCMVI